ncbi:hypothetical protein ACH4UR_28515 [Streptomyces lydicus]|uniref:hypothetical protein n=1 Tax=Streptomyces lydicus TaxID=47763 RepID=UPI003404F5C8
MARRPRRGPAGAWEPSGVRDDGRHDRLGYSWVGTDGPWATKDLPPCVASAPFETLESGDFTVVPWRIRH